jgi:transcriptional regulator with XRE-family HTH domain
MEKWFFIIASIERGMSLREIAIKIGTSKSSVHRYKSGLSEPRYSEGQKLLAIHASICSKYGTDTSAELACDS